MKRADIERIKDTPSDKLSATEWLIKFNLEYERGSFGKFPLHTPEQRLEIHQRLERKKADLIKVLERGQLLDNALIHTAPGNIALPQDNAITVHHENDGGLGGSIDAPAKKPKDSRGRNFKESVVHDLRDKKQ